VVELLFDELLLTIVGFLAANFIIRRWNDWRYGRWTLTVMQDGEAKLDQVPITPEKMKQVTEIPEDMPVFLKGMCSPFHHINCDLMRKGVELGVLTIDDDARTIIIDLDKDPKDDKADHDVI
jgi:hypothetical protein